MKRIPAMAVIPLLMLASVAWAEPDFASRDRTVAATVAGEAIYVYHVQEQLEELLGGKAALDKLPPRVVAEMLEQVIRQRLIEEHLVRGTEGLSTRDLDKAVEEARKEQMLLGKEFDEYLKQRDWTEATFRKRLAWSLGWAPYLTSALTDQRLEKFFKENQPRFDGSQIEASHLLLKLADDATGADREAARTKASQIRRLIHGGEMTFAEAARKYSEAPSGTSGGSLGSFTLDQMPKFLASVAFDLRPGKVTPPLESPYGIHLVLVTRITPGKVTWQQVRKQLEPLVAKEIFRGLAAEMRGEVKVNYTGALPHLDKDGKVVEKK